MSLFPVKEHKAVLEHVVTTVFCLEPKNEIWKAHVNDVMSKEHLDIYRFLQLDPDEVAKLEHKTKDSTTKLFPLTKGLTMLITNFQEMYWELKNASMDYDDKLILSITNSMNTKIPFIWNDYLQVPLCLPLHLRIQWSMHLILLQSSERASNETHPFSPLSRILTNGIHGRGSLSPLPKPKVYIRFVTLDTHHHPMR